MKTVKIVMLSLSLATLTACNVVMPAKPISADHYHTPSHPVSTSAGDEQIAGRGDEAEVTDTQQVAETSTASTTSPASVSTTAYVPSNDRILRERYVPSQYPYMQRDILSYGLEALVAVGKLCVLSGNCWRI